MSMTREEAIELKAAVGRLMYSNNKDVRDYNALIDFIESALRPVSREQVEKVWRGAWKYSHTSAIDHFAVVKCSKCGHEAYAMALHVIEGNFCPACGAPMTDEAVDMVMERWKEAVE